MDSLSNMNDASLSAAFMESNFDEEKETFNFPDFPYVCQKRFAEILDPTTLKTFSKINAATKNLVKRCHIIEKAVIENDDISICKYTLSCFCRENEFCRGISEAGLSSSMKKKLDVHSFIQIENWANKLFKTDARYLQSLPFTFDSCKRLILNVRSIKLDDLKMIMPPGLKRFGCTAGIESDASLQEFMDFVKTLTQLDVFHFCIFHLSNSLSFNIYDLIPFGATLEKENLINSFKSNYFYTSFTKWHKSSSS